MKNKTNIDKTKIIIEKIITTYENTPNMLTGNIIATLPLTLVLWKQNTYLILLLDIFIYSMLITRFTIYKKINIKEVGKDKIIKYDKINTLLIFITGLIWGIFGILLFDEKNIGNIALLVLTYTSLMAGSLLSLSSRPLSYTLFSVTLISPIVFMMLTIGDEVLFAMGFGALTYLILTFGFLKKIHSGIENTLILNHENLALIEELKIETERANKASDEKSRFLAAASHDLRQPLQSVNLFTEILENKIKKEENREYLSKIKNGITSLNDLIDALFDISKLDSEFTNFEKCNFSLDDILKRIEEQFRTQIENSNLQFSVAYQGYNILSNPLLIERVITNILTNAIKYTKSGKIEINLEKVQDQIHLHITDTGIGIKEENIDIIFEEFFQVNNKERESKNGLGLGLAIVRKILYYLDHRIEVSSTLGKGSTFTIILTESSKPIITRSQPIENNKIPNSIEGLNIVIVDNEESIVTAMVDLINTWSGNSQGFTSTETALTAIQTGEIAPDFLIVDYRMPGQYNGCEFVEEIRRKYKNIPSLIVTGDTSEEMVKHFEQYGFDYLHKPVKPTQLRIIIRRIIERHKKQDIEFNT